MAPTEAELTCPYSAWTVLAFSATKASMALRSLRSRRRRPWSSAILNAILRTPSWVSLSWRRRASRRGPISETVARSRCPCSPKTSQKMVGEAA